MGETSTPARLGWLKRRVDKIREDRKLTEKAVYLAAGMTKTGWRQMWERDTVKMVTLVAVAKLFKISVAELLSDEPAPVGKDRSAMAAEPPASYSKRRPYMDEWIADVERRLARIEQRQN